MARPETDPGAWTLYEPASDMSCRFVLRAPGPADLCPADLDSNDRVWDGGWLHVDRYHASKTIRAHRDGRDANLEINYVCDYACRHCFQSLVSAQDDAATPGLRALCAAAERLIGAGAWEISITGGDIFLHPDVWRLLDWLQEAAPRVTLRLLVNGGGLRLEDEAVRGRLCRLAGRRVLVKSDFFGHSAEVHDAFTRVPGSFTKLVAMTGLLRQAGVACLPTAAVTQLNFAHRFELVNFLYDLTGDSFTVASAIHPSEFRSREALSRVRVSPEQHRELMEERFFAPLAAEHHSFESRCEGDCQVPVVSAGGSQWGCSFLKLRPSVGADPSEPLERSVREWRAQAVALASVAACSGCPARHTCRRCPSFLSQGTSDAYCVFSRQAYPWLVKRVGSARRHGFAFIHAAAGARLQGEAA